VAQSHKGIRAPGAALYASGFLVRLRPRPLLPVIPYPLSKRLFDKVISGALLALLSPVVLVVLATMGLDMLLFAPDRGSFLYREPRISRGRTFELLKFRTLRADIPAQGHARLREADRANLTWAGRRVLKPWYLDELPQLLNVLRGDISLVGPRPWPPPLVEQQVAEGKDYRLRIMAGLTGPAQVTKGGDQLFGDLDERYGEACRTLGGWALLRHDLRILRQTVRVLARGEGLEY
jgi:lipopolysaccharide/colanic/teichoic acid biosynthesis glycosyltransferase